jgi:hypothetical protein
MNIYYVARTVNGKWDILDNAPTYDDASELLTAYSREYPESRLSVVSNTHFEQSN